MTDIELTVNGESWRGPVEPRTLLVHFLRDRVRLTGTKIGCDTGHCGACTVLVDGRSVKSCNVLVVSCRGSEVRTIEGVEDETTDRLRASFHEHHALQCGYCTAGMVMAARSLLDDAGATVTREQVRDGLRGNLCRCTGYRNIVDAVVDAAQAHESPAVSNGAR
jgi:carbon-monoxide dehydrogenase small subunit